MVEPVRFESSFKQMVLNKAIEPDVDIVVEIGPHSALAGPIRQCLADTSLKRHGITYASCLQRGKDAVQTAQSLAATLFERGCALKTARINFPAGDSSCHIISNLPSYPWTIPRGSGSNPE